MPISLRVPADVAERIARLVAATQSSAHAFMLEAIREKVEAAEAQAAFHAEAKRRLAEMQATGRGIPVGEVFDFLRAKARRQRPKRPRARKTS